MGLGLARGGADWRGRLGADFDGIQAQNLLSEDAFGRLGLGWDWGWLEGGLGAGAMLAGTALGFNLGVEMG